MKIINLTNAEYDKLTRLSLSPDTYHTEADFYHSKDNPNEIYKIYDDYFNTYYINYKIRSINYLNRFYEETHIPGIVIPSSALYIEHRFRGIVLPKIEGQNSSIYLRSKYVPLETKIIILKQIGTILKRIRSYYSKYNCAYADVHADNFMVEGITLYNPTTNEHIKTTGIDTESMKLYDLPGISNFYFYNNENLQESKKYTLNSDNLILPDYNTDIYCFIMMILELVTESTTTYSISIDEFNRYLDYLDKLGFDTNLLESFISIYENDKDNIDPLPYLDKLTIPDNASLSSFRSLK